MKLELRHAQVVVTIARAGSISRAAAELSLPQPSLTTQLRRIERLVGGELFVRTPRGVVLTPLGERLVPMLTQLLRQSDAVLAQARSPGTAVVRLGVADWTPATLRTALDAGLPDHEVETTTVAAASLVDELVRGTLTAAVVTLPTGHSTPAPGGDLPSTLVASLVAREPIWVATAAGSLTTSRTSPGGSLTEDLRGRPWVRYGADHPLSAADSLAQRQFAVPPSQVLHQVGSQLEAAHWVTAAGAAAMATPTGPLGGAWVRDPDLGVTCGHHLVHRQDGLDPEVAELLLVALRRHWCRSAHRVPAFWPWVVAHQADGPDLAALITEIGSEEADLGVTDLRPGQDPSSSAATRRPISSPTTNPASLLSE